MSVEIRNKLNSQLQLHNPLPATVLFDQPCLDDLCDLILAVIAENSDDTALAVGSVDESAMPDQAQPALPAPASWRHALSDGERVQSPRPADDGSPNRVAIVGMACRFPGAPDLAAYWHLLANGIDAVKPIPPSRSDILPPANGDGAPAVPSWAGLLEDIDAFDPLHFQISPREAPYIDPQHRILLETTWHAFEDAGIPLDQLAGSRTGVFIGVGNADHALLRGNDLETLNSFSGTGSGSFAAANRISYTFDLAGPSLVVDTACASSLTALHLAVTSLNAGDCDIAIVGGVNLILHPSEFISLQQAQVLSPTGRCRSFSADADGYVRGEGCGVVILRREADALAAHDRICALVRGTAISHVGRSNGMSAPNGPAQEEVMRAAAARAGIDPAEIDYLEAQGTGTSLGDAIELGAIRNVMAPGRDPAHPLRVGAAKSNIGNVEEASGMAGLIKTVLAMEQGLLPPTLHFQGMNRNVRLGDAPIEVVEKAQPWARGASGRRLAAVSGFGFGGANAHAIIEEASAPARAGHDADAPFLLALRARTEQGLANLATLYLGLFEQSTPEEIAAICASANAGRGELAYRLSIVAEDAMALRDQLRAVAAGKTSAHVYRSGKPTRRRRRVGLVFAGLTDVDGTAVEQLYADDPAFRSVVDRCATLHDGAADTSLLALLKAGDISSRPAHYALHCALAAVWTSRGLRYDSVVGAGVGELAAAAHSAVFDIEDGMRLAIAQAALLEAFKVAASGGEGASDGARDLFMATVAGIDHSAGDRLFTPSADGLAPLVPEDWGTHWFDQAFDGDGTGRAVVDAARQRAEILVVAASLDAATADDPADLIFRLSTMLDGKMPVGLARAELMAGLFAAGCPLDFGAPHGRNAGMARLAPLYPFERESYAIGSA